MNYDFDPKTLRIDISATVVFGEDGPPLSLLASWLDHLNRAAEEFHRGEFLTMRAMLTQAQQEPIGQHHFPQLSRLGLRHKAAHVKSFKPGSIHVEIGVEGLAYATVALVIAEVLKDSWKKTEVHQQLVRFLTKSYHLRIAYLAGVLSDRLKNVAIETGALVLTELPILLPPKSCGPHIEMRVAHEPLDDKPLFP